MFALYRRYRAPGARLTLVGDPVTADYAAELRRLADSLAPGAVTIESGLSEAELGDRYRSADVFLCLSAHEGFCAPLLEAFHFGVPVIARPRGQCPRRQATQPCWSTTPTGPSWPSCSIWPSATSRCEPHSALAERRG